MGNIRFDLRINFFGGANRIEYEDVLGRGMEDTESFKGISFRRLNHLIKEHLKQVADLNLRLVKVSEPKTIFNKAGISYTFEEPNNPLSGVLIYIWTQDLDAQNLERVLSLGLEINKARRVAMRKLASSKILNVEFWFTGGPLEKKNLHKNISLKELNEKMKEYFEKTVLYKLGEIAKEGHIKTSPATLHRKESKKFFYVSNINSAGYYSYGGGEGVYIKIWTEKLSPEDLETFLGLGLELNKWDFFIKKSRSPIA